MKTIHILIYLNACQLLNIAFSYACGWMEGVLDYKLFGAEKIAGYKKHIIYTLLRGCFWTQLFLSICLIFKGWQLVWVSSLFILHLLLFFRYFHDGAYHYFRNKLDTNVSPKKFKQDGDGLSKSFIDVILGSTYKARLMCLMVGILCGTLCKIIILKNIQ